MTKLILVGGFLGSGKTTLLAEAAKHLVAEGNAVGLITNDQAPELVDTRLLSRVGQGVSEVAGSCFCCHFDGFVEAVESLISQGADTIIAEPVGSCTDLSATILNPIKQFHPEWNLAPLTVLVDPNRLLEVLGKAPSQVHPDALYIMQLQMEEADRILVNKSDALTDATESEIQQLLSDTFPGKTTGLISAKTGKGVSQWLAEIQEAGNAGATIVPVDYDRYARGEAVLGWLNVTTSVSKKTNDVEIDTLLKSILTTFQAMLQQVRAEVGHVKAILHLDGKECVANLTSLDSDVDVRNTEPKSDQPILILNARVQISPEELENMVRELLATVASEQLGIQIQTMRCLMPGRPNPTHRFAKIV
ncbi:MAG: cobalamin biosynthesis protein P47K [Planctomycetaceae bacterium]|nr:cobalamin biosynthesis protein P47K [Planctomycetaceae bacterium]